MMLDALRDTIVALPRPWKRAAMVACDGALLSAALYLSYSLERGRIELPGEVRTALLISAPAVAIPIFFRLGLYRSVIRFLPDHAVWSIAGAAAAAALLWTIFAQLVRVIGVPPLPSEVPLIYWALSVASIVGVRYLARWALLPASDRRFSGRKVLIYGTGEAGRQMADALRRTNDSWPVGFLDDDPDLRGRDVAGLRVYSPADLPILTRDWGVKDVIVCKPGGGARQREIIEKLSGHGLHLRLLPPIADIARGRYLVSQVRDIDVADLLGRSAVEPDMTLLRQPIEGRSVLVTGAGGSIGYELARQIAGLKPARIVLLEANEHALYEVDRELRRLTDAPVEARLGSVAQLSTVAKLLRDFRVETVFHAAAHKHVPLVESNALEGIRNNVVGTSVLASAAFAAGVERFVLISSDKAVQPSSVMGATKFWGEAIVKSLAGLAVKSHSDRRFCAVRFGNVLGSRGSVVPLFKEQIARGGPVTLTHEDMSRYFMSIHEAVELIIQTASLAEGGELFALDMGTPIRIRDLAVKMIELAGLSVADERNPEGDIEIKVTGPRAGEKLREELFYDPARAKATRHPKILRVPFDRQEPSDLDAAMKELDDALRANNEAAARRVLFGFVAAQAALESGCAQAQSLAERSESFEDDAQTARRARALH